MTTAELPPRIARKIRIDPDSGCWLWTAATHNGYGRVFYNGINAMAYRVVYELLKGQTPRGIYLDHLCENRACVNPDHLDRVTNEQNLLRGTNANKAKTHCIHGHPFDETNTYYWRGAWGVWRQCRACHQNIIKRKKGIFCEVSKYY